MMKYLRLQFTLIFCLLYIVHAFAQSQLSLNNDFHDTYFYKIDSKQALDIFLNPLKPKDTAVFSNLVYVRDRYSDSMPLGIGNYIKMNLRDNQISYEYFPVTSWRVYVLDNKEDLIVQLLDLKTSQSVRVDVVRLEKKDMIWDEKIQAYVLKRNNMTGMLSITNRMDTFFFSIVNQDPYNHNRYKLSRAINRIIYSSPLWYITNPIRIYTGALSDGITSLMKGYRYGTIDEALQFSNGIYNKFNPHQNNDKRSDWYSGRIYFNKPIYRQKDTIKFKAFILNDKKRRWYEKPLMVYLNKNYQTDIYLGEAVSKGKGAGYNFGFVIADSMDIDLDKNYEIELKDKDSVTLADNYFKYENYELKKAIFEINLTDGDEQIHGKPYEVEFTSKDENGLPMPDTRASIFILSNRTTNVIPDQLFVPDTLWTYTTNIIKGNEKIIIPDSIFPEANVDYKLKAILQNSENERKELNRDIEYKLKADNIKMELLKDSILVTQIEKDSNEIRVYGEDQFDNVIFDTIVHSSFQFLLNTNVYTYNWETEDDDDDLNMERETPDLYADYKRTKDSVFFNIVNPRGFPIVYHIYKTRENIKHGTGKDFPFTIASDENSLYYLLVEYIWAGETKTETFSIPYLKNQLKLKVEQPANITPGRETEIKISATDINDEPIKDLNLLAYAYTQKFGEANVPGLPDLGIRYKIRNANNSFRTNDSYDSRNASLNYTYWNKKMLLDTNRAYRFRYPSKDSIEYTTIPMKDSVTQIAPFVVMDGALQPIQYVYIDNVPVYFGFTNRKLPYSFEIDTNIHQIKIRTREKLITIKDAKFKPYVKTIFSIDQNQDASYFSAEKMPDTFTNFEKDVLYRSIMTISMAGSDLQYVYLEKAHDTDECIDLTLSYYKGEQVYDFMIGPVHWGYWNFKSYEGKKIPFEYEPYYTYSFGNNVVKMKSNGLERLPKMFLTDYVPSFNEEFPTKEKVIDNYEQRIFNNRSMEEFSSLNKKYTGTANLHINHNRKYGDDYPANIILGKPDDFNFIRIYPGNTTEIQNIPAGKYQLLLVDRYNYYRKTEIIDVKDNGTTFYRITRTDIIRDGNITRINQLLNELFLSPEDKRPINLNSLMSEYVRATYKGPTIEYTGIIIGRASKASEPEGLPGASIKIVGTNIGTQTDLDGRFEITIPEGVAPVLIVSYIGYTNKTVMAERNMKITLDESDNILTEVLIRTPYGPMVSKGNYVGAADVVTSSKFTLMSMSDITQAIEGAAPGVQVTNGNGEPGSGAGLQIRGRGSLTADSHPLIVIDGRIFNGDITSLDPMTIANMSILKDAESTGLYGARGANGVIVITTKIGASLSNNIKLNLQDIPVPMSNEMMISSLRNNFKDDAYWQPDLVTDENGKATFKVKFPDDITNWKTFVFATDDKQHTGASMGNIKSYKPVAASLYLPHFLLDGDTALLIGKSLNYIPDTIPVTTSFYQNNRLKEEHKIQLGAFHNDTILLTEEGSDSIKLKYLLTKEDGYFDGEEKTIPLQRVGVKIAEGAFLSLDKNDTSFTIYPSQKGDTLHLSATASLIDVLLDEINVVRDYGYMCNEQKASKILAFLAKQKIYALLQKPFDNKDKNYVQGLIDKIIKSQNKDHQWGWWDNGTTIPWISNHVLKALTEAKALNYNCKINSQDFANAYINNLERDTLNADIPTLQLLAECGVAINYEKYISRLERNKDLNLSAVFELILLRQKLHLPYRLDKLKSSQESDLFGNIYWKDTSNYVYNNEVLTTLNALRILQIDTSTGIPTNKIINWLIQQRTVGGWRNTYESSNIITALAENIPLTNKDALKPVLQLNGAINEKIETFPYKKDIRLGSAVQVHKSGYTPVYFSWYYNKWDTSNTNIGKSFKVQSSFTSNGKTTSYLPAGTPVIMNVNINVEKSAEFVMIEIRIPAGCSYQNKDQSYSNYEIHREYFEDKVSIFCEKLPKGNYEYKVNLLPRYQGSYTLNPAKAELMYFPVFYGREQIKRISIKE